MSPEDGGTPLYYQFDPDHFEMGNSSVRQRTEPSFLRNGKSTGQSHHLALVLASREESVPLNVRPGSLSATPL